MSWSGVDTCLGNWQSSRQRGAENDAGGVEWCGEWGEGIPPSVIHWHG